MLKKQITKVKKQKEPTIFDIIGSRPKPPIQFGDDFLENLDDLKKYIETKKITDVDKKDDLIYDLLDHHRLVGVFAKIKFLVKEVLITEFFVNRIAKLTKRPIVVIGVAKTGVPYTYSIKPDGKKIILDEFKYPSSDHSENPWEMQIDSVKKKLREKIQSYKSLNPVFVFVDSSKRRAMPSSFVGLDVEKYLPPKDSLKVFLDSEGFNTKLIGYDWSMRDGTKQLPKTLNFDGKNAIDAILFNPSKSRPNIYYSEINHKKTDYQATFHDDSSFMENQAFMDLVLLMTDTYKKQRFGK